MSILSQSGQARKGKGGKWKINEIGECNADSVIHNHELRLTLCVFGDFERAYFLLQVPA
jgi:hypothetical protein